MTNAQGSPVVTQDQIEQSRGELVSLCREIQAARERLAPLREEMDRAHREYQSAVQHLYARCQQLEREIELCKAAYNQREQDDKGTEEEKGQPDTKTESPPSLARPRSIQRGQEAERKEELLEFLVWFLDDSTDRAQQGLLSTLTEMGCKQSVQLADMLEQIPTSLLGEPAHGDEEDLVVWYGRLQAWHKALSQRLIWLEGEEARLSSGPRHDLWAQYRQGPAVWQSFLERERRRYLVQIQGLEARLRAQGQEDHKT